MKVAANSQIENKLDFDEILELVEKPGQYLGNEWGAVRKSFESARARLLLAFPDIYELGMSNFGLKILYQVVNQIPEFMVDRTYAPARDMEAILREREIPLWAWESRRPVSEFDLVGFSLQYELTYTNVLNMLELSKLEILSEDRESQRLFPLVFGGGPSAINPEPMAAFFDFFMIGDGESAVPRALKIIDEVKSQLAEVHGELTGEALKFVRRRLLYKLALEVPGIYVPILSVQSEGEPVAKPRSVEDLREFLGLNIDSSSPYDQLSRSWFPALDGDKTGINERVFRQVSPLNDVNQPTKSLVPYLALVHDREVLEVRRGCDRGCRFCQPGYSFLPVRERSAEDILDLSKKALANSGHEEYSMLSLCVSDYTSLTESVRALNREHSSRRTSISFPSQRADRMNLDIAEELKTVRKSGITLAPEAGTERMRRVINKGLNHQQIISAIESAYKSGWNSVKLYFMCCLPTETDEDLMGIIELLKEATEKCRLIRRADPDNHAKQIEFTCTISNFVPKPFTPFQWFGQVSREETRRKHRVLKNALKEARLNNVTLNVTEPEISLLEAVISRGDRSYSDLIYKAFRAGATFDAWDDQFRPSLWHEVAEESGTTLEEMACVDREVGSTQAWEVVHIGLHNWWMQKEWEKAISEDETGNCTENTCHACGVCTELDTNHELANPSPEVMKKNPFVKELAAHDDDDSHPSLFFTKPQEAPPVETVQRLRFEFTKTGDLRFIGHLDLQTLLIRALRRAQITMSYSQGFNPSPKLSLAAPLSLFMESSAEVAELEVAERIDLTEFRSRVNAQLPEEVQVTRVFELMEKPVESLSSALQTATYRLSFSHVDGEQQDDTESVLDMVSSKVDEINEADEILVAVRKKRRKGRRKKKSGASQDQPTMKNIRDGIKRLELTDSKELVLEMELSCNSELYVKPQDLLERISPKIKWRICRTGLKGRNAIELINHDLKSYRQGDTTTEPPEIEKELSKVK